MACRHSAAWVFAEAGLVSEGENAYGRAGRDFFILRSAAKPGMYMTLVGKVRCNLIRGFVRNAAHLYWCPHQETEDEYRIRTGAERRHSRSAFNRKNEQLRKEKYRRLGAAAGEGRAPDE